MTRVVMATRIKPDCRADYVAMHAQPDPVVAQALRRHGHENYRLDLVGPYAIASFDYSGTDLETDRQHMRALPELADWMARTKACQEPLCLDEDAPLWSEMTPIFTLVDEGAEN
ncbi:MAG: L-rhamnose mutarotase [Cohaesibacter sp.]|nr:L-rhamnose mutarotase [Cohaesibacter sp.]